MSGDGKRKKRTGHSSRRFVLNRGTGQIVVRSGSGDGVRSAGNAPFDSSDLLEALIEVEELLSPAFAEEQVPPVLTIAFLADGIYGRLTGESEIGAPELRAQLCQFVLLAWSRGQFTPSPAFPYSYEEVLRAFTIPPEQDEALSGDEIEAALTLTQSSAQETNESAYLRLKSKMKGIDLARNTLLDMGIRALRKQTYALAEHYLRRAVQADLLDESEACHYLALACLWQRDFGEASHLFECDREDREGEAPLSWLFAEWCTICASSSLDAYMTVLREGMEDDEDPLAHRERQFAFDYDDFEDEALQDTTSALFAYLRGQYQDCLQLLGALEPNLVEIPPWVALFWSAMAKAALGQYGEAKARVEQAVAAGIPPLFLLPLRWYEQRHPAFYERAVRPLFTKLELWPQVTTLNEHEQEERKARRERVLWWLDRGRNLYAEQRYQPAQELFLAALNTLLFEEDLADLSAIRCWLALTCLQQKDLDAAEDVLFDATDSRTEREGPSALSTLLEEWCRMCRSSSMDDYFASVREALDVPEQEHPLDLLESFSTEFAEAPERALYEAVMVCLRGDPQRCLDLLATVKDAGVTACGWLGTFWEGMANTCLGHFDRAQQRVRDAVTNGMPPILLLPLRWLHTTHPDDFAQYLEPILVGYNVS